MKNTVLTAGTLVTLAFVALVTVVCALAIHGKVTNDHAKIERDKAYKVACVEAGKSLIDGNCIKVAA